MAGQLQRIVDSLARRLDRSVAVDDRHSRLLVYSSHVGHVDDVRKESILARRAPEKAWAWAMKFDVSKAPGPVRVQANKKMAMDARICAPVRAHGVLLGYMWLIDADLSLTDADLEVVAAVADEVGLLLHREQTEGEREGGQERELLRDLLSEDPKARATAAEQLLEHELFAASDRVSVLVLVAEGADGRPPDDAVRTTMAGAFEKARRLLSSRHRLQLVRPSHALMLVAADDPALPADGMEGLGHQLIGLVGESVDTDQWKFYVGIGDEQKSLADAAVSYEQAQQAVRIARTVPVFGSVASWSSVGIYRLLSQFPVDGLMPESLPPGLLRIIESKGGTSLAETLERYLDLACDAKTAAASLSLHRASLYYRLHQIEEIAGASLKDGEQRLALHLGLKLARLAGLFPDVLPPLPDRAPHHISRDAV